MALKRTTKKIDQLAIGPNNPVRRTISSDTRDQEDVRGNRTDKRD